MVGMNGGAVFYVRGYNAKSQQKEERVAFKKVPEVLTKVMCFSFLLVSNKFDAILIKCEFSIINRQLQTNHYHLLNWDCGDFCLVFILILMLTLLQHPWHTI